MHFAMLLMLSLTFMMIHCHAEAALSGDEIPLRFDAARAYAFVLCHAMLIPCLRHTPTIMAAAAPLPYAMMPLRRWLLYCC